MSFSLTPAARTVGLWSEFWKADILSGSTINYIPPPQTTLLTFPLLLFLAALAIFIVFLLLKRDLGRNTIIRSALYSSLIVGFIFAFRMDYNWFRMLSSDLQRYSGKDIAERVAISGGNNLYQFMEFVRNTIPEGEEARSLSINQLELGWLVNKAGGYYLLPTTTSKDGRFIWVNEAIRNSYDPAAGVLSLYGRNFRAMPYATYRPDNIIFMVEEELK